MRFAGVNKATLGISVSFGTTSMVQFIIERFAIMRRTTFLGGYVFCNENFSLLRSVVVYVFKKFSSLTTKISCEGNVR